MSAPLAGTVAAVTGASSGIGAATARALAAEGATVALLARRRDRLDAVAAEITDAGGRAAVHELDVTDPDAVTRVVGEVGDAHGRLDVLVANAGYGSLQPVLGADPADWWATVDVNLRGVLATVHAALPLLLDAAGGPRGVADVVTVGSDAGRRVMPVGAVYAATKHAVGAFSGALRQELAPRHVRVGVVEPGMTRTELPEKGQGDGPDLSTFGELGVMEAEDVADAIAYVVTRPRRTAVSEVLLRPAAQAQVSVPRGHDPEERTRHGRCRAMPATTPAAMPA